MEAQKIPKSHSDPERGRSWRSHAVADKLQGHSHLHGLGLAWQQTLVSATEQGARKQTHTHVVSPPTARGKNTQWGGEQSVQ